jgi:hypothetical protein
LSALEREYPALQQMKFINCFLIFALLEPGFVLEHFNTAVQNQQASLSFLVCGYMDPDPAFLSESGQGTRILMAKN